MATVYDYDLHDLGQSAFRSIQERALLEQSLRDATPTTSTTAPSPVPAYQLEEANFMKALLFGAATIAAVTGVLYVGSRLLSAEAKA